MGTIVGVIAGSVLAHLAGDRVWLQILIVLVALFLGLYLYRVNYTFMTIGITVLVSQLYVELGEFSNSLLLLRLEETAIGAGVAMATVLLVLPLHIGRVARVAARQQLTELADLIDRCLDRLADPASACGSDLELRAAARRVDPAYQALVATVYPLRTPVLGRLAERIRGFLATTVAARNYARNLLLDADASTRYPGLDPAARAELALARRQLAGSIAAITTALDPPAAADAPAPAATYVRSASRFAGIADTLPASSPVSHPAWPCATCSSSTALWPRPPPAPASASPTWTPPRPPRTPLRSADPGWPYRRIMSAHEHGEHRPGEHEHDEAALTELLELDGEVLAGYLDQATAWIAATAEPPVTRVVDLGAGTGTGTFALLRRFPEARVTAVDLAPDRLTRLRHRACELGLDGRVDVVPADLDQSWPDLGPADLVWTSMALHHVADPDQALTQVLGLLRPGGVLAVAETTALESFPRFLPAGAESGLEDRLHHLLADRLGQQVPELGVDWGPRLTAAGFDVSASRTFAVTLTAPLPPQAGRYAQLTLDRLRSGLGDGLDPADQKALAALVADEGPDSVRHRADLTVRATRLVWLARRL